MVGQKTLVRPHGVLGPVTLEEWDVECGIPGALEPRTKSLCDLHD